MAWLEAHQSLENHPKVERLCELMDWMIVVGDSKVPDRNMAIGILFRFWWWCQDYAEAGDLRKHNDERLGKAVGLNGDSAKLFVTAMVEACWLEREPYFRVHDWWDYIGPWLRSKYKKSPDRWKAVRQLYRPGEEADENPNRGSDGGRKSAADKTRDRLIAKASRSVV